MFGYYKMSKYFIDKSNALLASGISNINVLGAWDPVNKLYILTFLDSNTPANNETIAFHEPTNRWITFYSFIPENYALIGETVFISFKDGKLYTHNENSADRCEYYGTDYSSEIWIISNELPLNIKIFESLVLDTNQLWTCPDEDSIIVFNDSKNFQDQESYVTNNASMVSTLKSSAFKYKEGEYRASFLRDAKTQSTAYSVYDLINGRVLRGKNILIKLENSNTDEVYLRSVTINSSISK